MYTTNNANVLNIEYPGLNICSIARSDTVSKTKYRVLFQNICYTQALLQRSGIELHHHVSLKQYKSACSTGN